MAHAGQKDGLCLVGAVCFEPRLLNLPQLPQVVLEAGRHVGTHHEDGTGGLVEPIVVELFVKHAPVLLRAFVGGCVAVLFHELCRDVRQRGDLFEVGRFLLVDEVSLHIVAALFIADFAVRPRVEDLGGFCQKFEFAGLSVDQADVFKFVFRDELRDELVGLFLRDVERVGDGFDVAGRAVLEHIEDSPGPDQFFVGMSDGIVERELRLAFPEGLQHFFAREISQKGRADLVSLHRLRERPDVAVHRACALLPQHARETALAAAGQIFGKVVPEGAQRIRGGKSFAEPGLLQPAGRDLLTEAVHGERPSVSVTRGRAAQMFIVPPGRVPQTDAAFAFGAGGAAVHVAEHPEESFPVLLFDEAGVCLRTLAGHRHAELRADIFRVAVVHQLDAAAWRIVLPHQQARLVDRLRVEPLAALQVRLCCLRLFLDAAQKTEHLQVFLHGGAEFVYHLGILFHLLHPVAVEHADGAEKGAVRPVQRPAVIVRQAGPYIRIVTPFAVLFGVFDKEDPVGADHVFAVQPQPQRTAFVLLIGVAGVAAFNKYPHLMRTDAHDQTRRYVQHLRHQIDSVLPFGLQFRRYRRLAGVRDKNLAERLIVADEDFGSLFAVHTKTTVLACAV